MTKTAKQRKGIIITVAIVAGLSIGFYLLLFFTTYLRGS